MSRADNVIVNALIAFTTIWLGFLCMCVAWPITVLIIKLALLVAP